MKAGAAAYLGITALIVNRLAKKPQYSVLIAGYQLTPHRTPTHVSILLALSKKHTGLAAPNRVGIYLQSSGLRGQPDTLKAYLRILVCTPLRLGLD